MTHLSKGPQTKWYTKQVKLSFTNYQPKKLLKKSKMRTICHKVWTLYLKRKNHSISKNISKKFGYFLQNLEKLVKLQVKFAIKNCKQKLQVSFEFKTSKTRFYKQPITRFEFSKKKIFKKYQKITYYQENISKNSVFFFKILKKSKIYK